MDIVPGLQDFDFMEIDPEAQWGTCPNPDPNLNVTSVPEQLDIGSEATAQLVPIPQLEDPSSSLLIELSTVCPQTIVLMPTLDQDTILDDLMKEYSTPGVSVSASAGSVPDFPYTTSGTLSEKLAGPATVTLFRPQLQDGEKSSSTTIRLIDPGFFRTAYTKGALDLDVKGFEKQSSPHLRLSAQPADVSTNGPSVPMFEPLTIKPVVQTPAFDLISPADSVDTGFTFASEDSESTIGGSVTLDRTTEIERMAAYIREVIEKRGNKPDDMSSKLKVHEVILVILLNSTYGDKSKDLQRILTFCDENGRELSCECRHFKTLDTETMGRLWQKIKRNSKGNYDTFARAMRVRRERTEGFFEYLNAGKGKKKRIYRFGDKSMEEMVRFKRTLKQVSRPQGCSY